MFYWVLLTSRGHYRKENLFGMMVDAQKSALCALFLCLFNSGVLQHMKAYKRTLAVTYSQTDGITTLVEAAGQR